MEMAFPTALVVMPLIGRAAPDRAGARPRSASLPPAMADHVPYRVRAQIGRQERVQPPATSHYPAVAYNLRGREERIKMRAHTDDADASKNSSTQDRPVIG